MKISIKPSDIIKRALWYKYENYILDGKSKEEIRKIINEDEEFEIREEDALIINFITCIETDNLRHKLNDHIKHLFDIRSTEIATDKKSNQIVITKNLIENELEKFLKNFPDEWESELNYKQGIKDLKKYIAVLKERLQKLQIHNSDFQGKTIEYIQVNHVKKMLEFNH